MIVDMYDGKNDLTRQVADWKARAEAAEAENIRLRAALAQSELPCVYCALPADEWAKCEQGFPGCGRADDAMGCPELGNRMRLVEAEARVKKLEARLTVTDEMVERAAKAIAKTFLVSSNSDEVWMMGSGSHCVEFSGLIDPLPLARAALTAALEGRNDE